MVKKILKEIERRLKVTVGPLLGAILLYTICKSMRWVRNDLAHLDNSNPVITAFWHGRQLMLAPVFRISKLPKPLAVLISAHSDGRMIAAIIRFFRLHSVAGSSSRGGVRAMIQLIELLQQGISVGITPDGPRGPVYRAKEGVIKLAQVSGVPIYPVSYSASRTWSFRSWDKMILPKPFSRGVCLVGEPLYIPKKLEHEEFERCLSDLEQRLIAITKQSDEFDYA